MKKLVVIALGMSVLFSCTKKSVEEPVEPVVDYSDLSREGTSNCYLVSKAGTYHFDATVKGNGKVVDGLTVSTGLAPVSAGLVWESAQGLISDIKIEEGEVTFTVGETAGNALLAAYDAEGAIVWSWHIWFPEVAPVDVPTKSEYTIQSMNLGALCPNVTEADGAKAYGMLYQWGRKDPFVPAGTLTGDATTVGYPVYGPDGSVVPMKNSSWYDNENNTIAYSIANPTVCLSNYSHYTSSRDWLKMEEENEFLWANTKTLYDPCPVGYKVPALDAFKYFTTSGGYSTSFDTFDIEDVNADGVLDVNDYNYGWSFAMAEGYSFFPAAARYDGSYAMLMGSVSGVWGTYWSCNGKLADETLTSAGMAHVALTFMVQGSGVAISPSATSSKADAYSVRCVKE